jgi:drug/metabolite transporter (DMT)-like permease
MNLPSTRDYLELLLLSAIWGSSFLFLRIASPEFGPVFLIEMRVLSGLVVLLPLSLLLGKHEEVFKHWRMIFVVSLTNMAVPFCFFAYAALNTSAGLLSILNATVPFFTAIVALVFFQQRLSVLAIGGMLIGFIGIVVLVFNPAGFASGTGSALAALAALFACVLYGIALNLVAHKLQGVSGMSITVGSLFFSSIVLLPFALWQQPVNLPQGSVWLSVLALGVLCTGFGYILFYRLIARIGSQQAIMTTYLISLFSMLWGYLFLAESITFFVVIGCMLVLGGVGMTTGKLPRNTLFSQHDST